MLSEEVREGGCRTSRQCFVLPVKETRVAAITRLASLFAPPSVRALLVFVAAVD